MSETTTIPGTQVRVGDTVSQTRSGVTRTGTVAERIARALEEAAEKHPNPIVRLNLSDAADIARSHATLPAIGAGTVNGLDVRDWQQIAASKDEAVEAAVGALNRVRELHQPVDIEPSDTICGECSFQLPNGRYFGKVEEWPCATIQALAATPPDAGAGEGAS